MKKEIIEETVREELPHEAYLKKEGYVLETTVPFETDAVTWTKPTRYGTVRCKTNGVPLVTITRYGQKFSISIQGESKDYWASPTIYDLSEELLIKNGRELEMRITDAWRELVG